MKEVEDYTTSKESSVVYVGREPPMSYVLVVMTSLSSDSKKVVLKARGRAIATAVDVAEITRHRFIKELAVEKITIGTEELPRRGLEGTRGVSSIEITLSRSVETEMEKGEEEKEAAVSDSPLKQTAKMEKGEEEKEAAVSDSPLKQTTKMEKGEEEKEAAG